MENRVERFQPTKYGFKFFKPLGQGSAGRRFWRRHLSDSCSGEFQVEKADRTEVGRLLDAHLKEKALQPGAEGPEPGQETAC
jgi:hypothetical protein